MKDEESLRRYANFCKEISHTISKESNQDIQLMCVWRGERGEQGFLRYDVMQFEFFSISVF